MDTDRKHRIVVLGGGFGGVYTTLHLEKTWRDNPAVDVCLISRENYYLMSPLLFEASSGVLEPRHVVTPIRQLFRHARFIEAEVERVDFDRRVVVARHSPDDQPYEIPYDQLVTTLGGVSNQTLVPGSQYALSFKNLADAIYLRNHVIDQFERADVEENAARREELLTFAVIGGGLVGVELIAELAQFVRNLCRSYRRIDMHRIRLFLIEAGPKILPEMERGLAGYAYGVLEREGIRIMTRSPVERIEPGSVAVAGGFSLRAKTVLLAVGISANPLLASFPLEKDKRGRIAVDGTLRSRSHPEVWALGDCASIPNPDGGVYPSLAQHALREAKVAADNITAVIRGKGRLSSFVYKTMGMLAALGHYRGVGRVLWFRFYGFAAWWIWRTYYLMQMPRIDRRLRIMLDWTIALFFHYDAVQLDLFGREHPRPHPTEIRRKVEPVPKPQQKEKQWA